VAVRGAALEEAKWLTAFTARREAVRRGERAPDHEDEAVNIYDGGSGGSQAGGGTVGWASDGDYRANKAEAAGVVMMFEAPVPPGS
jgi:hypothetical protein